MTRDIDSPDYRDSNIGEGMIPPRLTDRASWPNTPTWPEPWQTEINKVASERNTLRSLLKEALDAWENALGFNPEIDAKLDRERIAQVRAQILTGGS